MLINKKSFKLLRALSASLAIVSYLFLGAIQYQGVLDQRKVIRVDLSVSRGNKIAHIKDVKCPEEVKKKIQIVYLGKK